MPSKRRKRQTSGKGHTSGNSNRIVRPRKGRQQAAAAPTHVPASDSPPAVLQQPQQTAVDANDATMVAPATAAVVATTATTTTTTPAVSPSQSPVHQRPPVAWCYYGRHKHGAVLEQQTVGCLKEHIAHLERLSDTSSLTVHLDGQLLADDDALSESYLYDVGHVFPGTMKPTGMWMYGCDACAPDLLADPSCWLGQASQGSCLRAAGSKTPRDWLLVCMQATKQGPPGCILSQHDLASRHGTNTHVGCSSV
ncbi:hypothetical protein BC831DRAFT_121168 [Entophlyctis helioformis]|nr:hypothetical protein BC831DRAFT_121168 [Entophlyctis helioformis]